ncbi:BMP family ABC transporter substrate-binding protein [uncultured Thiothrix sp.]|jgi:basic membrane protein A|uniref:BMP family lipoprotein n=1 Tax=uncultured Thiothrix sp. TaxID=223185 RepID=UPI00260CB3E6|nr:BMP family ABC transporter substrate-binding protein [uncultured Thiothrix sp.]HMT92728.1 BMP family ABC transporter substrate-binding protein [Thiolinea sp.]
MKKCLLALLVSSVSTLAVAADLQPAIVYDLGTKFDKSFNEGVSNGAKRFTEETKVEVREFEPANDSQIEQAIRKMASRGSDPIISVGFSQANALTAVAKEFPKISFTIIDSVVEQPNVRSVTFKEEQGSFLVGALAAMVSKTGKVGFVGGQDIALIRKFACGYEQGAKYIKKDIEVFQNMTGSTGAAWNNPSKGGELAKSQFDRGADVIFAAAGGTGIGVYQAAKDNGKYAIGVDSNQNHLQPGTMLTSMIKRVDNAAYDTFKAKMDSSWKAGVVSLGLAEKGVGWAVDEHNEALVKPYMEKMAEIEKGIVDGSIKVHDYMTNNQCEY